MCSSSTHYPHKGMLRRMCLFIDRRVKSEIVMSATKMTVKYIACHKESDINGRMRNKTDLIHYH